MAFIDHQRDDPPLIVAIQQGDVSRLVELLDSGEDIEQTGIYRSTALRQACDKGQLEAVKVLIQHNADVNSSDDFRNTPLLSAIWNGHQEIVELLLEHGARKEYPNDGFTIINLALNHDHQDIAMFLLRDTEDSLDFGSKECGGYLITAVKQKHVEIIDYLLDKGVNINHKDDYGWTPLMVASCYNATELATYLLARGADVHLTNKKGCNALMIAKTDEMKTLLFEKGATRNEAWSASRSGGFGSRSGFEYTQHSTVTLTDARSNAPHRPVTIKLKQEMQTTSSKTCTTAKETQRASKNAKMTCKTDIAEKRYNLRALPHRFEKHKVQTKQQ